MTLTRDQIFNHDDLKRELVETPEWGGDVYVREMSGSSRDTYELRLVDQKANGGILHDIRAAVAALTICDETGGLIFSTTDIEHLSQKSNAALDRICDVAQRLNPWLNNQDNEAVKKSS